MAFRLFSKRKPKSIRARRRTTRGLQVSTMGLVSDADFNPAPAALLDSDPVTRMHQQGRLGTIVHDRSKYESHPMAADILHAAERDLEERTALVPAGNVTISTALSAALGSPELEISVEPFLLDVDTVTNARFQYFVDGGGYDALEVWPEEIWPHIIEFKDLTGEPGPRPWRHGRHHAALGDHPVVGINWYEAQAFALWIGQRLPSEAEWEMAASWHINSSTDCVRRFPWGDEMDRTRCNVWTSRHGGTVPVWSYPEGVAPNQVRQLVGNVWEWTDSELSLTDEQGRPIVGEMPMRALRGGAFDTYFDAQATSAFRSGQVVLARTHNVGFRCALDLSKAYWMNLDNGGGTDW